MSARDVVMSSWEEEGQKDRYVSVYFRMCRGAAFIQAQKIMRSGCLLWSLSVLVPSLLAALLTDSASAAGRW
jgi:hypothetical protein